MKKFLNFDKTLKVFYDNIWLDDQKIVIKIPLLEKKDKKDLKSTIEVERFNLANKVFLLAYE
ncbi:MAG: hypothetical protein ACFFDK_12185 [Promethearchaeota archaeon]